jgi:UDPglucose--hexose-1-phosphate uridylyltransferase
VLALPGGDREPNTSGWTVRVVPNLYPAVERQEVVIHSPRHARSIVELMDGELELVATAWDARVAGVDQSDYVHPLINEGRAAGASLPHSHSQLVWLPEAPPAVRDEHPDAVAELLHTASERNTIVAESEGLVAFCHPVGRLPYETLIVADAMRDSWPGEGTLAAALRLLRQVVQRLHAVEGAVPWNAWLHHGHTWHFELVPRLSVLAGLELGAGIYVNSLPPDQAAENLRATGR